MLHGLGLEAKCGDSTSCGYRAPADPGVDPVVQLATYAVSGCRLRQSRCEPRSRPSCGVGPHPVESGDLGTGGPLVVVAYRCVDEIALVSV